MSSPISAFLDYQTLSAVSRAATAGEGAVGGWKSQPLSQRGESVLKRVLFMSYFHFLENTCAIVGGHGYLPRAPKRGKMRGGRATHQGEALPRLTQTFRVEGRGRPCLPGGLLQWAPPFTKALMSLIHTRAPAGWVSRSSNASSRWVAAESP